MAHDQGSTREAGAYGWQEARVICQELSQRGKSDQSRLIPLPPRFCLRYISVSKRDDVGWL